MTIQIQRGSTPFVGDFWPPDFNWFDFAVIPVYRALADHIVPGWDYVQAGSIFWVNGWAPTGDVDPLSPGAVINFYAQGPQLPGLIRQQWVNSFVAPPITRWVKISKDHWALNGLGADSTAYPPIFQEDIDYGRP